MDADTREKALEEVAFVEGRLDEMLSETGWDEADALQAMLESMHRLRAALQDVQTGEELVGWLVLDGEAFLLERDDDGPYYVRHRKWSLVGRGADPGAALVDLVGEARDIADIGQMSRPSNALLRMLAFCQRLSRSPKPNTSPPEENDDG